MDARLCRAALAVISVLATGASYRTDNFIVSAPSAQFAKRVGDEAETFRDQLAKDWLGHELPRWEEPCPITINVGGGAGGATSFVFDQGRVFGWQMNIQGSPERILDSVLPHEVMHTVFATHFRRPLPRWADEGACTTVEHSSERAKQDVMLVRFLRTQQGIAFSRMFAMKDYPANVMPLYSQGYSLARFLIAQGGRREYLAYLDDGMKTERWSEATKKHYGYEDLGELQDVWLAWVAKGSPPLKQTTIAANDKQDDKPPVRLASTKKRTRPTPNLIYRTGGSTTQDSGARKLVPVPPAQGYESVTESDPGNAATTRTTRNAQRLSTPAANDAWRPTAGARAQSPDANSAADASPNRSRLSSAVMSAAKDETSGASDRSAAQTQVTRPKSIQKASQVVVQRDQAESAGTGPTVRYDGPLSSGYDVIRR